MKNLFVTCALFLGLSIGHTHAQGLAKASDALKSEMQKLSYFTGKWKGEATARNRDGSSTKIIQDENIYFKLDNTILVFEGTGRNPSKLDEIVFNAFAIVSYDELKKEFRMTSHVMDGKKTDAYFKVLAENHIEWGFDLQGNAKMRYDIKLDPKTKSWYEIGEYSPEGSIWYQFIELKLIKVD